MILLILDLTYAAPMRLHVPALEIYGRATPHCHRPTSPPSNRSNSSTVLPISPFFVHRLSSSLYLVHCLLDHHRPLHLMAVLTIGTSVRCTNLWLRHRLLPKCLSVFQPSKEKRRRRKKKMSASHLFLVHSILLLKQL